MDVAVKYVVYGDPLVLMRRRLLLAVDVHVRVDAAHVERMRQGAGREFHGVAVRDLDLGMRVTTGIGVVHVARRRHVLVRFLKKRLFTVLQL